MSSNKKITLIISSMLAILALAIVILLSIGSRQSGYDNVKKKAYLTAEIVKSSLTSHMINGNMDQRDTFLSSISQLENIDALWIVRAKSVSEQFGTSNLSNESPRDSIDLEVLENGNEKTLITENLSKANLRVTIPYIASSFDKPNCLSCHNASEGEVLGAISLSFDITEDRLSNIIVLFYVMGTIAVFITLILLFIKKRISPYTSSLDNITSTLKRVHQGDYTIRVKEGILREDKEALVWLNELIEKLETVLTGIEKNLTAFVHNRSSNHNHDKLITAKEIIEDISDIYHYKKTIENDLTKEDIYHRLSVVLKDSLKIKDFYIFETDLIRNERKVIYGTKDLKACCNLVKNAKEDCRAERTNAIISSETFPGICKIASCLENEYHTCIPFIVNEHTNLVIHLIVNNKEDLMHIKYQIGIIKKYLEETKPILESKILMDALERRNLTDALTGLYNRKYLEDFIDKKMPDEIEKGTTYAVMFLDIDYFKMVNDTYGHDVGDDILRKLAITLKSCISQNEFIIRYGGEEFLILMKNPSEESAKELALKINSEFSKLVFNYNNDSFSKTISIGYSFFPEDAEQIYKCIKYADIALYEAKATGRNKVVRFTKDIVGKDGNLDY